MQPPHLLEVPAFGLLTIPPDTACYIKLPCPLQAQCPALLEPALEEETLMSVTSLTHGPHPVYTVTNLSHPVGHCPACGRARPSDLYPLARPGSPLLFSHPWRVDPCRTSFLARCVLTGRQRYRANSAGGTYYTHAGPPSQIPCRRQNPTYEGKKKRRSNRYCKRGSSGLHKAHGLVQ